METARESKREGTTRSIRTPSQYLTFRLAEETYAVGILQAREILRYEELTKVPSTPDYIHGVLNLRGAVVPVVDLAVKFGLPKSSVTKWTCIVIVETILDGEDTVMGILADSVSEVLNLTEDDIEPPPAFGTKVHGEFLIGMGQAERKFILILDIDKVLSQRDVVAVDEAVDKAEDTNDVAERDPIDCKPDKVPNFDESVGSKPQIENEKQKKQVTESAIVDPEGTAKEFSTDKKGDEEAKRFAKESADDESNETKGERIQKKIKEKRAKTIEVENVEDSPPDKATLKIQQDKNK